MNDKKMSSTEKFNKWHSERMGHPLGVQLGKSAVEELTEENKQLREHLSNLVNESIRLAQFKNDTLRSKICSTDLDEPEWHDYQTIGEAGAYLELLNK